jgi:hypothetical protein
MQTLNILRSRTAQVGNCNRIQTKLKFQKGSTDQWSGSKPVVTTNSMETRWSWETMLSTLHIFSIHNINDSPDHLGSAEHN